jgi:non-ribosomal peptide synthetase component E (peptide arylation enzyme)
MTFFPLSSSSLGARLADARVVVVYLRDAVAHNSAHERAPLDKVVLVPFAAALWHGHLRHASAVTREARKSEWLHLCRPPARPAAGHG